MCQQAVLETIKTPYLTPPNNIDVHGNGINFDHMNMCVCCSV